MWLEVTLERLRLVIASDRGSLDLYALMTLLLLLSLSVPFWYLRGPQVVLVLAGFVLAPLRKNAGFWLVLAVLILIEIYLDWLWLDSFKYLIAYWCLALSCSLRTNNPEKALAATAGWLLGLSFLFAVFRKSPCARSLREDRGGVRGQSAAVPKGYSRAVGRLAGAGADPDCGRKPILNPAVL